jgi:hypothetical protein
MGEQATRLLIVLVCLLIGVIAGMAAGILMSDNGTQTAVASGSAAFVASATFVLTIMKVLRLL